MKKTKAKFLPFILCLAMVVVCLCGCAKSKKGYDFYKVKDVNVYSALEECLNLYTLDQLSSMRVTVRQPIMEVLERNIRRYEPNVMSDIFKLTGTDYEDKIFTTLTQSQYPGIGSDGTITKFQKYMLLRYSFYNSENGVCYETDPGFASFSLPKHPAADKQYGAVPVKNNAVKKLIITDPDYRSSGGRATWLTTGLYLPAGETAIVTISGLKPGEKLAMTTNLQQSLAWRALGGTDAQYQQIMDDRLIAEYERATAAGEIPNYDSVTVLKSHYERTTTEIPVLHSNFQFTKNGTYKIASSYGGQLHLTSSNASSPVRVEITGCVETPHFVLGVTTPEYYEKYLRNAPGLQGTLDVESGQLVGPAQYFRNNVDDILKVAYMWHSNFAINNSFNGQQYNFGNVLKFDRFVPAGAAVCLSSWDSAMPDSWLAGCLNFESFKKYGNWGTLHELGHQHASAYGQIWGMNGKQEGEVRNNALIVLNYLLTCNMDPMANRIEHGFVAHPYTALQEMLAINPATGDFNNLGYFQALSLYANIMHQLSPKKFVEVLYTYSFAKNGHYSSDIRADFAYRLSMVYDLDFREFLNYYKAGITDEMYTAGQLKVLNGLTKFIPIACKYSNGVNGSESAAKYTVSAVDKTVFDFKNNIISTEEFTLLEVTSPVYGTLKQVGDTYEYTPSKKLREYDNFSVVCQLNNGLIINLPVNLQFSDIHLSYTEVWQNISAKTIEEAILYSQNNKPTSTAYTNVAGQGNYNAGKRTDFAITNFNFVAQSTGEFKFYFKADDLGLLVATHNDQEVGRLVINKNTAAYSDEVSFSLYLQQNEFVHFTVYMLNTGGGGFSRVGVNTPNTLPELTDDIYDEDDDTIIEPLPEQPEKTAKDAVDVSKNQMVAPGITVEDYIESKSFGWEPVYIVSIKNFTKISYINKDKWQVIEAPLPEDQRGEMPIDYLIDGNNSTIYYSKWTQGLASPLPHNYVLDMGKNEILNFIQVFTRNNPNSYVKQYEVYLSQDNVNYNLVASGDDLTYELSGGVRIATIKFDTQNARYIKFVAKSTTGNGNGNDFSIISEFYAGLTGQANKLIKAGAALNFHTKGFKLANSSGSLVANKKGSAIVMRFKGTTLNIYANTNENSGRFAVYIDGKHKGDVDLSGEASVSKLVYAVSGLKDTVHQIELKTLDKKEVGINFMSIGFGEELINAPNIYKEHALTISLIVFCVLFVVAVALIIMYFTWPEFKYFFNKLFRVKEDSAAAKDAAQKKRAENREKRKTKRAIKQQQKEELNSAINSGSTKTKSVGVTKKAAEKSSVSKKVQDKGVSQKSQKLESARPRTSNSKTKK